MSERRVVVTGLGVVCPLGLTVDDVWTALVEGTSGIAPIGSFDASGLPLRHAAEARCFTGGIADFGELEAERKKAIRKGLKVMCRETQMAMAAAQRALHDAGDAAAHHPPERFGCVFGSDYMLTLPEDFTAGIAACRAADGSFDYDRWADVGMPLLNPLWLLKYLPNMPASHIAIFNDLRGPSNSLTVREASGHLALGEACVTIQRGMADIMVAGATGTRVHPMKTVHALQTEQVALPAAAGDDPARWSRPFDKARRGMVLGEGAAVLVLEELGAARRRGARIYAELAGNGAASAADRGGIGRRRQALAGAIGRALESSGIAAEQLGHVHAQGVSTVVGDREEAAALADTLGAAARRLPTVAAKSHFGNLGAGSGLVECVASIVALSRGELFPLLNHETADEDCPLRPARRGDPSGDAFVSAAVTPQGQAGAVVLRRAGGGPAAA
ncbi:MAG: beta-ketoacyl-[acyl-carrier-protein] synthase family protein [Planctomycetota bacterium]